MKDDYLSRLDDMLGDKSVAVNSPEDGRKAEHNVDLTSIQTESQPSYHADQLELWGGDDE